MERTSAAIAAQTPALGAQINRARETLRGSAVSAPAAARGAELVSRDLDRRSRTAARDFRSSLAAARDASAALNQRLQSARPAVQTLSKSAVGTSQKIKDMRAGVAAIQEPAEQVESGGLGPLISGPLTPVYQPKNSR
jgi:hypothetical protein